MEISRFIDVVEIREHQSVLGHFDDRAGVEYAMCVEFDALFSDGDGEVEDAAGLKELHERLEAADVAFGIDGVAVAAEAEVFEGMEAGEGVAAGAEPWRGFHDIELAEGDVGDGDVERADVEDLDFAEGGDMGDETVDARTDIHVFVGVAFEDFTGDEEVLVEVVAPGGAALGVSVMEAGAGQEGPGLMGLAEGGAESKAIHDVAREVPECGNERNGIQPKRFDPGECDTEKRMGGLRSHGVGVMSCDLKI